VAPPRSRYRSGEDATYSHRFHAGNVGDVWKHCALVEILRRAAATGPVHYVDTHAGEGRYALGPTGEWSEGIGRLWPADGEVGSDPVARYVAICARLVGGGPRPARYPGSPAFARAVLGPEAQLTLWERDEVAFARLAAGTEGDRRVRLLHGDGLGALPEEIRAVEAGAGAVVALVDPPYTSKADWSAVPAALVAAVRHSRRASVVLWYPVKSLTRPNAMIAALRGGGVSGAIVELVTTPLEHQRHRLNGSGLVLVRPPEGTLEALGAAAALIGARCATRRGTWSLRMQSWRAGEGAVSPSSSSPGGRSTASPRSP
jgi:23S rRNA (adenine2030-N6)-methyltransferase